ncbi:hypothetical protein SLEP1_g57902 [Rubroshorea leprosula]|uniref:Uncharacterized protein n=1 Tax=Rubroshorea leprosula TaxID=152421 RepID=A0AAV5MMX3_9ROSI|nr:hypothetical protein SLEP1_g57902 [Rubroshorea leprosula]
MLKHSFYKFNISIFSLVFQTWTCEKYYPPRPKLNFDLFKGQTR